ncbi:MAG: creatininase family protein, partial [Ruthenibacterium sp.]
KVAEKLGTQRALVLPAVPYGQVWSLRETAGTVDIPDAVLTPFLTQIAMSMHRAGVRRFAFVNAHVGNLPA